MPITLPYTINDGDPINALPLRGNFQSIADKFNAGLTGADFSASANLPGTLIAVGTLPANRIVNNDITAAQVALATLTGANLAPATVAGSNIAATTVLWGNLKTGIYPWTPSGSMLAGATQSINTGLLYANTIPLNVMVENATLGTIAYLTYGVYHNPADDKLSLYLANNSGGTVALGAAIFKFFYALVS